MSEPRTKQQFVYNTLKEEIVAGKLKPGTRLTFRGLAERLQVSEIPVREAVKQLETEGLMTTIPHTGVLVSQLSADEVREIYQLRETLEPLAARLAAPRISNTELEQLEKLFSEMEKVAQANDGDRYAQLNREFHSLIYQASGNCRLHDLIFNLWDNVDRYRSVFQLVSGHMARSLREHRIILDALRAGDAETAYHAMMVHRRNASAGLKRLEQLLAANEHPSPDEEADSDG